MRRSRRILRPAWSSGRSGYAGRPVCLPLHRRKQQSRQTTISIFPRCRDGGRKEDSRRKGSCRQIRVTGTNGSRLRRQQFDPPFHGQPRWRAEQGEQAGQFRLPPIAPSETVSRPQEGSVRIRNLGPRPAREIPPKPPRQAWNQRSGKECTSLRPNAGLPGYEFASGNCREDHLRQRSNTVSPSRGRLPGVGERYWHNPAPRETASLLDRSGPRRGQPARSPYGSGSFSHPLFSRPWTTPYYSRILTE